MALGRSGSIRISNAHVLTMDPQRPTARAVVIHDGIITFIGSDEGAKTEDRGVDVDLDAGGRTLIPGFNDAHGHFIHEGLMASRCDLADATSIDDAYRRIRSYAAAHPELEMIVAERWDESSWPRRHYLTRSGLDEIESDRPVLARRVDGHIAVANSKLLDLYDEHYQGPEGRIDHETGLLREEPALSFGDLFPPTRQELDGATDAFIQLAKRNGVTSAQDFENVRGWKAWQRARRTRDREGEGLGVRVDVATYSEFLDGFLAAGLMTGTGDDWLAMGGLKIFVDGSLGGRTAYLNDPYADDPGNHGVPTFDDERLFDLVRRGHEGGLQHRMHVIGDAAVEQGTRAFEKIAEEFGVEDVRERRHRFEHYELSTPAQRKRAKSLGIVLSMQPNFVGTWATEDGLYGHRLGERHKDANPFATIRSEGLPIAFGSDVMPFGPIIGIRGAMTGPYPQMRLDFIESVRAYTSGSAFAQHREHVKGMLRPGMLGDCVLLNKDMSVEDCSRTSCLEDLDVQTTILDGHVVYGGM